MLRSLLVGDNAFIGVSHLSHVQARQKLEKLRLESIVEVIRKAISNGANGFAFSVHPSNLRILSALGQTGMLGPDFQICPVLPYVAGYVRAVNEKGISGLVSDTLSKLTVTDKARLLLKGGMSALTLDPLRMLNAYLDLELTAIMGVKHVRVATVLLHEVVTDLCVSLQTKDLFDSYMQHVRSEFDAMPGFVTRNFVRFVEFFEKSGLPLNNTVIMTPFNSIGFQMNPSKQSCEECLSKMQNGNVIAMSILAGGYLGLDAAMEYLERLQRLSGVVVGVSSPEHAVQTFSRLERLSSNSSAPKV